MFFVKYPKNHFVIFLSNFVEKALQKICRYVKMRLIGNDKKITIVVKARKTQLKWRKNKWQEKLY